MAGKRKWPPRGPSTNGVVVPAYADTTRKRVTRDCSLSDRTKPFWRRELLVATSEAITLSPVC